MSLDYESFDESEMPLHVRHKGSGKHKGPTKVSKKLMKKSQK